MNPQALVTSRLSVGFGLAIARNIPTAVSYPLGSFLAQRLTQRQGLALVEVVKQNQLIVHGGKLTPEELHQRVKDVFTYAGRCFIDFYRNYKNLEKLQDKVLINDDLERLVRLSQDPTFGAFLVVPHLSSFDLMLLAAAAKGFRAKVLTIGNPTGGYKLQNDIRATSGLEIMPVSRRAHVRAIDTLRNGGFVLSGIDRPIPEQKRTLNFFGLPSPLPDGHVRMALKAGVPIMVAAVHMNSDGLYQLSLSEPIPMVRMTEPRREIRSNAENILQIIESHILAHPTQWQMFYPVWPEAKKTQGAY